jgi:hypothetical protein
MDPMMGLRYHCQTCDAHNLCSNCYMNEKSSTELTNITRTIPHARENETKSSSSSSTDAQPIVHSFESLTSQQTYERRLQSEIYALLPMADLDALTQVSMDRFVHLVERLTDYIMDCTLEGNSHHCISTHIEPINTNLPTSPSSSSFTISTPVAPRSQLLIPDHPHPLTLYEARGPHGFYICDLCLRPANGLTYACAPCKFDCPPGQCTSIPFLVEKCSLCAHHSCVLSVSSFSLFCRCWWC